MLVQAGCRVSALARSDAKAATLRGQGAEPVKVSIFDRSGLTHVLAGHAVVNLATAIPPRSVPRPARSTADVADQGRGAHGQGEELDAAGVELAEDLLVGDLLVHDQHCRVLAGYGLLVVAERDDLAVLGGLGDVGAGV